jgi:hypothetical protein
VIVTSRLPVDERLSDTSESEGASPSHGSENTDATPRGQYIADPLFAFPRYRALDISSHAVALSYFLPLAAGPASALRNCKVPPITGRDFVAVGCVLYGLFATTSIQTTEPDYDGISLQIT